MEEKARGQDNRQKVFVHDEIMKERCLTKARNNGLAFPQLILYATYTTIYPIAQISTKRADH